MATTLYLLRHGATAANLDRPYRLQGRRTNQPLAPIGVRQAELTRDLLALRTFDRVLASPLLRAQQTAEIIAAPRHITLQTCEALIECDVGDWEGLTWEDVEQRDPEAFARFQQDPAAQPYVGGESFAGVADRVNPFLAEVLEKYEGETLLVVSHHIVNRVYLAGLLGLPPSRAKLIKLANCGVSVVVRSSDQTEVQTLNAIFHLQGAGFAA
jgi:broad specificity phosphatase PhoE